ncbi:MAG: hypothetical protein CMK72_14825 [Pseudomonadaceae bacterium]|nr:hypothetical protein [Pseudomonadaceae bacterium]HCP54821.1 hypothetical protein [Pseudomonas sp.]
MNFPQTLERCTPVTSDRSLPTPKILLAGNNQPGLLRHLDGWPARWGGSRTFLIHFADNAQRLAKFANNSFDMAVLQAPAASELQEAVKQLVRVAKQGLITRN